MTDGICVIIAAYNSRDTIERAIRSALIQPEVTDVVVVDDASDDDTAAVARSAADGSGRLRVLTQESNSGPAAARNLAIAKSTAPWIAILDADDFYLSGRFAALLDADGEWDAIADNILFVRETTIDRVPSLADGGSRKDQSVDFSGFVRGNISRPGRNRGELGFLKPMISRAFLESHCLVYDERLRLGEDLDLYARLLAYGARMGVTGGCFYVAVERHDSISARHDASDLEALLTAVTRLETHAPDEGRDALAALRNHLAAKFHHRQFLLDKRTEGLSAALYRAWGTPGRLVAAAKGIVRDKWNARHEPVEEGPRFLLPVAEGS